MKKHLKTTFKTNLIIFALITMVVGVIIGGLYLSNGSGELQRASIIERFFPDTKVYETEDVIIEYPIEWFMVMIGEKIPYSFRIDKGEDVKKEEYLFTVMEFDYMGTMESFYKRNRKSLEDAEGANYLLDQKRDFTFKGYEAFEIPNDVSDDYKEMLRYIKVNDTIFQILYVTKTDQELNDKIIPELMEVLEGIEFK